jgi:Protein of unknown function (DUF1769)/Protein of unknown function, DUF547
MGTSPSLLSVPSTAPSDDATYIQKVFSSKFRVEDHDSESVRVLVGDGVTIVLVRVESFSEHHQIPTTWAMEDDEIKETAVRGESQVRSIGMGKFSINEIHLPGGATIVMVPFGLVSSTDGCKALATRLTSFVFANSNDVQPDGRATAIDNNKSFILDTEDVLKGDESPLQDAVSKSKGIAIELPKFPSLAVKLLEKDGRRRPFPLNSREPVDFETDLFKGKMIVIVRPQNPETDDPYWNERLFSSRKRRLVINLQGTFKREPQGVLYAGAEISDQMKMGLVTRGLCKILLRLAESFNKNLHYSFGDSEGKELPHIVAPAYTFFERVVVTPPGETLPPMDEPFDESPESIAHRKKTTSYGEWSTTDTYSFSFYSMYIDLPTWQLVGLPASGDLSLKTFWGQSLLKICMYEKSGSSKQHLQDSNRYAFSVQLKFLGKHGQTDDESLSDEEDSNIILWSERQRRSSLVVKRQNSAKYNIARSESQLFLDYSEEPDNEKLHFFDAEESHSESGEVSLPPSIQRALEPPVSTIPLIPAELLAMIDTICPFWIDLCTSSRGGGYVKAFAVNMGSRTTFRLEQACEDLVNSSPMDEVDRTIKESFSPRMSPSEKLRRSLGLTLLRTPEETDVPPEKVQAFRDLKSTLDTEFLRRPKLSLANARISGFVARALSDRHWVEEWAHVTERNIAFYYPEKRKAEFLVPLSSISKVERLPAELSPQIVGFHILVLTTQGRSVYLMFASDSEIDSWRHVIDNSIRIARPEDADSVSSCETNSQRLVEIDNAADEFLHRSSMWQCKNRRILNCGKFFFRQEAAAVTDTNPLAMAEGALKKAVTMSTEGLENSEKRRSFLDSVAELKRASLLGLDEASRLAFYLNVYHTMISHAFLVLGAPDSSLKWITYFNSIAYQVEDDIFSLTELEHCIIRAKMSYPTQFFSRFVIPKSTYKMALTTADYRINFALNCGSLSNPPRIILYKADRLQEQLDAASQLYLKCVTYRRTVSGDLELKLPKICQWFAEDFGSSRESLLHRIERFLPNEVRLQLAGCRLPRERKFDMSSCTIRFHAYNFECRSLSL